MIMVNGHNKARALRHGVEEPVNHMWTISCLQQHPHAIIVCDEDATDELKHGTYKYFKDIEKDNLLYGTKASGSTGGTIVRSSILPARTNNN